MMRRRRAAFEATRRSWRHGLVGGIEALQRSLGAREFYDGSPTHPSMLKLLSVGSAQHSLAVDEQIDRDGRKAPAVEVE